MVERVFHDLRDDGHEIEIQDHDTKIVGLVDGRAVVRGDYSRDNVSERQGVVVYCRGFLDGYMTAQRRKFARRKTSELRAELERRERVVNND